MTNDSTLTVTNIVDLGMDGYKYQVQVTDSKGCSSVLDANSVATLTVVEGPALKLNNDPWTKCSNTTDGELHFTLSAGETGQVYSAELYSGTGYSDTSLPTSSSLVKLTPDFVGGTTRTLDATGLAAGDYTVILKPVGGLPGLKTYYRGPFTVKSPDPVAVSIVDPADVCANSKVGVKATLTGGPVGGTQSYVWQKSLDNSSFGTVSGTTDSLTYLLTEDTYFRVVGTVNGQCSATSNSVQVKALPTPKVSVLASDTGCFKFDLHNLQVLEVSGIDGYDISIHRALPSSAQDTRYLINEADYNVTKKMTVYAMISVGGLCYDVKPAKIYIKRMEECYPIVIPEFFSPDGDGINDLFQMPGLEEYDNPEIIIFDRYGKEVFKGGKESLLPPNGWDGKYMGKDLPSGDYWYRMTFAEMKAKVGHFSLKRRKE
jgi:gliding motility-associated-like protein